MGTAGSILTDLAYDLVSLGLVHAQKNSLDTVASPWLRLSVDPSVCYIFGAPQTLLQGYLEILADGLAGPPAIHSVPMHYGHWGCLGSYPSGL